ncbi:hypothetical protein [Croceimicrobium hydrocarbonivorans]|uniref:Uncharacterized protein n=1 Tax=Croceimicrobium hydrocarbonivorans TaxID=2761580 RepID=A0A7H0VHD6_9FLAO|nr:hypothetical protein [Croceimicrobium hydrocarbonivorans]QNR25134.1 hypothetical protein H4K34_04660 [Croceimicrobium hydrocarbonivorans]
MKSKLRTYYFLQAGLLILIAFAVFETLRSLPYLKTWTELGKSGIELTISTALVFGILSMVINSTNFVLLKNNKTKIAFDLPSIIWLIIGISYLIAIQNSGAESLIEYLPIVLCIEPIMYNQRIKHLLSNAKLHWHAV